jgi:ABC-type transport system involved in multi-copper enzyme maturation permease subunit
MSWSATLPRAWKAPPWDLWLRQIRGIVALESGRYLFRRRPLFLCLLALAPPLLLSLRFVVPTPEDAIEGIGGLSVLFAGIYRTFFLRLAIFFGCVGLFTRLFRGDVLERTIHYYLLAPVRREVLVVGKYLSGVFTAGLIFGLSTAASFLLMFAPSGAGYLEELLLRGPGLAHLTAYVGVTLLACVGYGSVFLLVGLFFRNPIVPAAAILGWEYINFLLPPLLKKFSVIYYLESLCPVPIPEGPITILAEPAPFWMAVPGLLLVTAAALVIAALKVRLMEIDYGGD